MKQKIIFTSILSIFIIMVMPSIPAIEFDAHVKANESILINELQGIEIRDFKERIQKINIHEFREGLKDIDVKLTVQVLKGKIKDNTAQPQCIFTLMALIMLLKVLGTIIGSIFAAVSVIVDVVGVILGKIVALTLTVLKPIIKLAVLSLITYFVIAGTIDLSFLCIFILLIILTGGS